MLSTTFKSAGVHMSSRLDKLLSASNSNSLILKSQSWRQVVVSWAMYVYQTT